MYKISKEFHFEAAHHLFGLPEGHKCANVHGHSYVIIIHLKAYDLDETGFVEDYGNLKDIKNWIDTTLDHKDLNKATPLTQTSAENLARWIYDTWSLKHPPMYAVTVKETAKTSATYKAE